MKVIKSEATIRVDFILLSAFAILANSRSLIEARAIAQETQVAGYWIDSSTKLMWAGKDNGRDVSWKGAVKYCRNLRLAGYSDWSLATRAELGAIFDRNANARGLSGPGKEGPFTYHVKGNLFLTGDEWSGEREEAVGYASWAALGIGGGGVMTLSHVCE